VATDPLWKKLQADLLQEADRQLVSKPVERVLIGRRLLDKSRTALSRVLHLGLAWRLTGEKQYLERARRVGRRVRIQRLESESLSGRG